MTRACLRTTGAAGLVAAVLTLTGSAQAPHVYAIVGARVVTAAGPVIDSGTILVRNGAIEAVGATVAVPPEAATIDGKGLTVYPGLIDMGTTAGLAIPPVETPRDARTRMEVERARRHDLIRAQVDAAALLKADAPELERLASVGITSILATPPGDGIRGRSALVNVAAGEDPPQIGNIANERAGMFVVSAPVALHVSFPGREGLGTYPASLMGAIAFVRQAFLDGGSYQREMEKHGGANGNGRRPAYDAGLEALHPALRGSMPVVFEAGSAVEIRRVLSLAQEFKLRPVVSGAVGADAITGELKSAGATVIYSLNYPVRPQALAPGADEPIRVIRERANAPKVPAALHKAGVPFVFASSGLREPADFVRNAAKAVKAGLPAEAAVRALTIEAATLAGAGRRLGSIEKGKQANLVITQGDLFDDKMVIRHVFVDGRPVSLTPAQADPPRRPR
ncbi:MAG TPA: amidohydrolase family protein [Vicinamibacterales bacterium]|nr:amidohydrolase family protein [Vicinamibacterales bacterium]